ncbi:MAG TPA: hypothetical protein VFW63_04275 [Acidimicrobiales bacterium]|nr:hypothetical protein [Acidimicrobiales bacterium]
MDTDGVPDHEIWGGVEVIDVAVVVVAVPAGFPVGLHAGTRWPRLLTAGRVAEVIGDALHRLRVARLERLVGDAAAVARGVDGPRLLAATAFRLSTCDVARLLTGVAVPPPDRPPIPDPEGET